MVSKNKSKNNLVIIKFKYNLILNNLFNLNKLKNLDNTNINIIYYN